MKSIFITAIFFCVLQTANAQKHNYATAIIGFYNLENFYDTVHNPAVNDYEFLPNGDKHYTGKIYLDKVEHLATVISQIGTDINADGPALIGVAEIENDTVLNDLVHQPLLKNRNYHFIHYDSKDPRGIDVALLYNPKYFIVDTSCKIFVQMPGINFFTRDILFVKGKLLGETVYVFVNHWPSKLGGEERSAPGRNAAATADKIHIDSIEQSNPNAKIILMGDLNDDPISTSVTKILDAKAETADVKPCGLYNPWIDLYKKGIGTLAYQNAWGLFDQIMVNYPFLNKNQNGLFYYRQYIFNKPFMVENIGKYKGYPMRTWDGNTYRGGYSDHFPTYLVLLKKLD